MTLITRDVIHDLWVLYSSGEASEDTRKLVDDFLAGDPELARSLREAGGNPLASCPPTRLPPDHELRTLARIKRRLWGYQGLMRLALIFSGLAFGRIISDTSWDVSPRRFIVTAAIAAGFWIAFVVTLYRGRRSIVVRLR